MLNHLSVERVRAIADIATHTATALDRSAGGSVGFALDCPAENPAVHDDPANALFAMKCLWSPGSGRGKA